MVGVYIEWGWFSLNTRSQWVYWKIGASRVVKEDRGKLFFKKRVLEVF